MVTYRKYINVSRETSLTNLIFVDRELQGVIFVFNPDNDGHRDALDFYYDSFIRKSRLSDSNAIVFALTNTEANPSTKLSLCKCENMTM